MAKRIELPQTPQGTEEEQLRAMYSYLYQMAVALNSNLAEIGGSELTDDEMRIMREVLDGTEAEGPSGYNWREAETLKSMIIKTAQFVRTAIDEYNMKLTGTVEAEGALGRYVRNTGMDVAVNPEGITQRFSFQEIIQGLKTFEINSKNYIKSGLLRTEHALPVYGVAIGKDVVTFSEDGTETYNDGNKVAQLTADELSFWQSGAKIASYTGDKISFLYSGDEVFYIQNGKIYTSGDMQIGAGKKLEIVGNAGIHIQTNGKLQIDSGQLQIDGDGNATFSGTLAAAVVQALVLKGNQIQGGTLTLGGANNGNGRMVIQNANGQQIGYWDNTGLHVNEGEITGNAIKGGTLTLGGANNVNGVIEILDAGRNVIGRWNKDGILARNGTFAGVLTSGNWTFDSDGAQYLYNNLYAMGIGYDTSSAFNNGGLYFKANGTRGSQIKLQAKDSSGYYQANVILECAGIGNSASDYGGSFYQTGTRGNATISLGTANYPWYTSYLRNIKGPDTQIFIYPNEAGSGYVMFSYNYTGWLEVVPVGFTNRANLGQASARWSNLYVGDVNYTGSLVQGSSRDIKHNIRRLESCGERLDRLEPVTFAYNDDKKERKHAGLIYEDTIGIMPEICTGDESNKAISYTELIPMLLKEIQDLRARVKTLEGMILK